MSQSRAERPRKALHPRDQRRQLEELVHGQATTVATGPQLGEPEFCGQLGLGGCVRKQERAVTRPDRRRSRDNALADQYGDTPRQGWRLRESASGSEFELEVRTFAAPSSQISSNCSIVPPTGRTVATPAPPPCNKIGAGGAELKRKSSLGGAFRAHVGRALRLHASPLWLVFGRARRALGRQPQRRAPAPDGIMERWCLPHARSRRCHPVVLHRGGYPDGS